MHNSMHNIQYIISQLIAAGHVLQCEKTKSITDGGKQTITIGPYHTATNDPTRKYAMFRYHGSQQWEHYSISAIDMASFFVAFVGRDIARRTARVTITNKQLKPSTYGVQVSYDFTSNREIW